MYSKLEENAIRHQNPDASMELIMPVDLQGRLGLEEMFANVRENSRAHHEWICEVPPHDGVALVIGAGPSLAKDTDKIMEMQELGAVLYSCNSATVVLNRAGIYPRYHVTLDPVTDENDFGRAHNYLMASICPPSLFEKYQPVILWHPLIENIEDYIPKHSEFVGIGGGVTVGNSCLCLAYTHGFRDIHCFGMDSSITNGKLHAHDGAADCQIYIEIPFDGRKYQSTYTMKCQIQVFLNLYRQLVDAGVKVSMHGEGLLPDVFRTLSTT